MFVIALPVLAYWFFYFAPPSKDGGKDWARFGAMMITAVLSLPAFIASVIFAIKKRSNLAWWLLAAFTLTPTIVFFS